MLPRALIRRLPTRFALLRRFAADRRGATAIEFGLVATPFIAVMFAIIEVCMVFFAGQILEKATQDASRKILTGQAQTANFNQAQFLNEVCSQLLIIFSCGSVYLDVKNYTQFSSVNITKPIDGSGNFVNNFTYSPGNPNDIVVVRVMYLWQLFVPTMGLNLSDVSGNKKLLMATAVFRNEPY
jgi:Flp pilus assembly protein TadG